jgi:predicted metal-dependent hydrolase
MRRIVEDKGAVLTVRARPDDAVARLRRQRAAIRERLAKNEQQVLTNAERDLLLVAIAQKLDIL